MDEFFVHSLRNDYQSIYLDWYFARQYLLETGVSLSIFQPPSVVFIVVIESLKSDPLTLLFFGIALYEAYKIPKTQQLPITI